MRVQSIRSVKNLTGQTVFLRVDFNVPIKKGKILDDLRLRESLEDIHYLMDRGCKIILATHLGRPNGRRLKEYSTRPLANLLSRVLEKPIKFVDITGSKNLSLAAQTIARAKAGSLIFLENLRFNKEEQKNDLAFAKKLAALADIYVNNAFAVCHRAEASTVAIRKYLPSYAGLLLEKEITNLSKLFKPKKPLVVVVGGAKVATKLSLLKNLAKVATKILIGGALINDFLVAQKKTVGQFKVDAAGVKAARWLLKKYPKQIVLPLDVITGTNLKNQSLTAKSLINIRKIGQVKAQELICDIGPETIALFAEQIKKAQTIVWNGPLGLFEIPNFKHGTVIIARVIASRSSGRAFGVVGGGETVEAVNLTKMGEYIDWVSTGGGAMLSFLGQENMPGLKGLIK